MENRLLLDMHFFLLCQLYFWKDFFVYRTQVAIWMVYSLINLFYGYVTISVIYSVSSGIAGWSYYQMLFLVSTGALVFNTLNYVIMPDWTNQLLRRGGIDTRLIRPYGKVTIFLSLEGALSSVVSMTGAFIILAYSAIKLGLSPATFLGYVVLLAARTIALVLLTLMLIVLTYILIKGANTVSRLGSFMIQASRYPLPVYGIVGQLIFTLVIPVGLASYYPSEAVFGVIAPIVFFGVLAVATTISLISYLSFNRLMQYYTSGGG
jgi:ABC-2 type transport system permease protein